MDSHLETQPSINTKYSIQADALGSQRTEKNLRRQDKMIGAMVRKLPRVLLLDSIIITPQERMAFEARWSTKRLDRWKDSDIEQALSALPLPTMQEENIRQPVKTFKRFEGNETLQRRMRRVVSLVTRGTPATPDVVNPYDLYNFVKNKCRNAVAFERKIPEILQNLDSTGLGAKHYMEALNAVGLTLYGMQWVYLQQTRLLQKTMITPKQHEQTSSREKDLSSLSENPLFEQLPHTTSITEELTMTARIMLAFSEGDVRYMAAHNIRSEDIQNVLEQYKDRELGHALIIQNNQLAIPYDDEIVVGKNLSIGLGPAKNNQHEQGRKVGGDIHTHGGKTDNEYQLTQERLRQIDTFGKTFNGFEQMSIPSAGDVIKMSQDPYGVMLIVAHEKMYALVKCKNSIPIPNTAAEQITNNTWNAIFSIMNALAVRQESRGDVTYKILYDQTSRIIKNLCNQYRIGFYEADWNVQEDTVSPVVLQKKQ